MLDVAVGLIFVFLMLSVACSLVNERIQSLLDKRAKLLAAAIRDMLGAEAGGVTEHPLIQSLSRTAGGLPSYIPSATFAVALLESLVHKDGGAPAALDFAALKAAVGKLDSHSRTRAILQSVINSAQGDVNKARAYLEHWFDSAMERLSGVYKRHINRWLLGLGFVLALATNADSIRLVQRLEHESTLRAAVIAQATGDLGGPNAPVIVIPAVTPPPAPSGDGTTPAATPAIAKVRPQSLIALKDQVNQLDLLFWDIDNLADSTTVDQYPRAFLKYEAFASWMRWLLFKLAGCFMTALAVSLGAPFWFDLLGRLVNLRATGDKPAKTSIAPPKPPAAVAVAATVEASSTTVTDAAEVIAAGQAVDLTKSLPPPASVPPADAKPGDSK
ncbi:MAG TPA: hypothetical protein VFP84_25485 [Kofleriaceae bacterium]|nr:hypothetical protein [Kofleriaceae bacterium]